MEGKSTDIIVDPKLPGSQGNIARDETLTKLSSKSSVENLENSIQGIAIAGSDFNINESNVSIDKGIKNAPKNRAQIFRKKSTENVVPAKKYIKEKRYMMIEKLVGKLQESRRGIEIKTRKKMFKTYYSCFTGSDLVEWFSTRCKFLLREEGLRLSQFFLNEGYIINLTNEEKPFDFTEGDYYCFQAQEYWPSSEVEPTDEEYLVHLATFIHYEGKEDTSPKFEQLKSQFASRWSEFDNLAKERAKTWKAMDKENLKNVVVREKAYWMLHRSADQQMKVKNDKEEDDDHKIGVQTLEQWLEKFPVDKRLKMIEHRIEQYKSSMNMTRIKLSSTIRTYLKFYARMITRYEIYAKCDPLVNHGLKFNPFVDNPSGWIPEDPNEITNHDIRVWNLSFRDLLQDPKGLKTFEKFLKTEFSTENIYFWQKLDQLDKTTTRAEYEEMCRSIYKEFIALGSKNELNIDASIRNAIKRKIETAQIEEYLFSDAKEAIFLLMSKDSYQRFMQSPFFAPNTQY